MVKLFKVPCCVERDPGQLSSARKSAVVDTNCELLSWFREWSCVAFLLGNKTVPSASIYENHETMASDILTQKWRISIRLITAVAVSLCVCAMLIFTHTWNGEIAAFDLMESSGSETSTPFSLFANIDVANSTLSKGTRTLGGVPYPSKVDLGRAADCSRLHGPSLLARTAEVWTNITWDNTADVSIKYYENDVQDHLVFNPNHLVLDSWSAVMFAATHCMDGIGEKSRRVSISSFNFVKNFSQCYHTMVKADPGWQDLCRTYRIGTLVPKEQTLTDDEVAYTTYEANCTKAHGFSPGLTLVTGFLMAGPHGSIVELQDKHDEALPPAVDPIRWLITFTLRGSYRHWYEMRHAPLTEIKAMQDAFEQFRKLAYHYILPRDHDFSRKGVLLTRCRIALYDRSNETGAYYSRVWQDSDRVHQELKKKFPDSSIVILPKLPPRFADQVLLFSGLDVIVGVHGGWEPNTMFLAPPTSNKIVFNTRRWCDREGSGIGWIQPHRNNVGFQLIEVPCVPGSIPDSMLLYDVALPIILDKLKDRCT